MIAGLRCAVCGTTVDIAVPFPWRCPRATAADPYHVLHILEGAGRPEPIDSPNPFVRYGPRLAWWEFARANGLTASACEALTHEVASDFVITPFEHSASMSDELQLDLFVKDETGNVAGSHKARHLVGILLHLRAAETLGLLTDRPPLAIASCGNAALAAATLAAQVDWPLDVYVPTWMDDAFGERPRRARRPDPSLFPARRRSGGRSGHAAVPWRPARPARSRSRCRAPRTGCASTVVARSAGKSPIRPRPLVSFSIGSSCRSAGERSQPVWVLASAGTSRLDTVQTEGCAPLAETWERIASVEQPERYWSQVMRPWPDPQSAADGILDDETYDWIADVEAMTGSGGEPIVAPESDVLRANQLATAAGYSVSHTGSAGLAGVLATRDRIRDGDRIAVVMSGVAR